MALAVRCKDLKKRYDVKPPVEAVRGIDLELPVGECFGLLGPNGAGKTTTIEILEGLLPATSGEVEVLGRRWGKDDDAIRERIGISLQETKLSEKLTVIETLRLFRSFYKLGLSAEEALSRVSLQEKAKARVGRLSGGQKQRLAVACGIVGNPDLLFLDEPTTGLDPQSRRQLWDIIQQFRDQGRTVLLTTHYLDEAEKLCDRVAIVDHGKIIALGSPNELIASVGGEHVIEFTLSDTIGQDAVQPATFADLPGVQLAEKQADTFHLAVGEPHIALPALVNRLASMNRTFSGLSTRHASLEDVFVKLTGRHLRDEENAHGN